MISLRNISTILVLACLAVGCRDKNSSAGEITDMDRNFMAMAVDAAKAGFDDSFIYDEISVPTEERTVPSIPLMRDESLAPFRIWSSNDSKKEY